MEKVYQFSRTEDLGKEEINLNRLSSVFPHTFCDTCGRANEIKFVSDGFSSWTGNEKVNVVLECSACNKEYVATTIYRYKKDGVLYLADFEDFERGYDGFIRKYGDRK